MGTCMFCGRPVVFLRKAHPECKKRYQDGQAQIIADVAKAGVTAGDLEQLDSTISGVAAASWINSQAIRDLVIQGWEKAVGEAFDDGVLSEEEEKSLAALRNHFSLSQGDLDGHGAYSRLAKGATLRDVLNGQVPRRVQIEGNQPFNLQKSEQLVWLFKNVTYYEQQVRTKYVGGSQGVSIRIARGVYYRTGAFKGERVQSAQTVLADTGLLGITTKNVYFAGPTKRFRIPYSKIVTFEPYSDGFGIQRDSQSAKPQTFATGDGWFAYNLVTNLAQL